MVSRFLNTSLHASIAQTEILRALQDVADMEARANKKLADNDQPPLPRSFFSAAEMDELVASHEAAIAELKPKPPDGGWEGSESQIAWRDGRTKHRNAAAPALPDLEPFADKIDGMLADPRIGNRRFREACRLLVMVFRPRAFGRIAITAERRRAVAEWIDLALTLPLPPVGQKAIEGATVAHVKHSPVERETDAAIARAVAAGVEDGSVVELPLDRNATAKFIVASYSAALREQEEKP